MARTKQTASIMILRPTQKLLGACVAKPYFGSVSVSSPLKLGGYPKLIDGRWKLTGGRGEIIGTGRRIGCTKIRPGRPGSWIDSERCSYQFMVNGVPYSCRGYGEGVAVSCRRMKTKPAGLAGRRRKARR